MTAERRALTSEIQIEAVACNLCGSSESRVRLSAMEGWPVRGEGHYSATTDKYGAYGTIRECQGCGLYYTSPRVKVGQLLQEYEDDRDEDYSLETEGRSMNAYLALAAIRRQVKGGRLLDVGCASGFLLNAARHSFAVEGVEPSKWGRRYAKEQLQLNIKHATLEDAAFKKGRFDVVTLVDVIEHVADPQSLMKEVARVTKRHGLAYMVTPDIRSLSARLLRGRWWGLRPAHITYFSGATLTRLMEQAGYEVISVGSYGRMFTWNYWLSRLSNYPWPLREGMRLFVKNFGLGEKFLYLDTRDTVQMLARKL